MSSKRFTLSSVPTFKDLPAEALRRLEDRLQPIHVRRGDDVVRQGEAADALYVVVSGRFAVEVGGHSGTIAEISRGSTIGEIAFFAGGTRTATVSAIRDGIVVRLTRADFDAISENSSAIWAGITATLADRLAAETRRSSALINTAQGKQARPRPRTIAIVGAASGFVPPAFMSAFAKAATARSGTLITSSATIADIVSSASASDLEFTEALNALESQYGTIAFIADRELTPWSEKAIRQADEVLLVASPLDEPVGSPVPLGPLEAFALSIHPPSARRLVVVHARRGIAQGTRHWLTHREPAMHHHVALGDADDIARLWRFLAGEALGFVACGGGAYCSAHIGVYRAFREAGIAFDLLGGTSGGAAMAAAFAQDLDPDAIDARVHRMFIEGRAMSRYTLPRYSLLDHTHFDAHLEREYGTVRIEDLWKPYFAVSADLSNYETELHVSGHLWRAIRASAAIPGLLPPFYTDDGRMLVDGSVISNVPVETMHSLKRGPNVVVSFQAGEGEKFTVDYSTLPRRRELIWRALNPFASDALPAAPSAATVLVRSLMANRGHFERHLDAGDWLVVPPTPAEMGALDWRRHSEIMDAAYHHTRAEIDRRGHTDWVRKF
ncbi:cyclic nucleotide-binding and patatin-like phospholipase domain-containing protein [Hyphomicrobium sp.]|uniref:cyclic nucleotide-binding and patatin-like phospholipase domain-containing protein n=1 Tax=Hyphomicrobium sp. TaxID=82 RepID=UPI001DC5EF70|nr:cyclic nucleotide-binding and patatin-like phospholipase domain-containing protein [Hyphomicrobium sp.]MBY0558993.1 patatin-like phospholipase family protein [Hyphomicrobium sp.]